MTEKKYVPTMWNDAELMKSTVATATSLSKSDLLPATYKDKPANCVIAIDIANRIGLPPLTVAQQLYVVKGKPAWSGQMAIALVDMSGKFEPLDFEFVGTPNTDDFGCYAYTRRLRDGKRLEGDTITIRMAKQEGWYGKDGSKWKTMPRQMLMYRSASFFARVYCPTALMGLQTIEEVQDVDGYDLPKDEVPTPKKAEKVVEPEIIDLTTPIAEPEVKEETTPIKETYVKDVEKVVEEVVQEQPSFIDSLMDEEEPAFVETPEVEVVEPQKVCCVKCGKELNENQIAFYQRHPEREMLCKQCELEKRRAK